MRVTEREATLRGRVNAVPKPLSDCITCEALPGSSSPVQNDPATGVDSVGSPQLINEVITNAAP